MDVADIKKLREETGAGVLESKNALVECGGDFEKARTLLMKKGEAKAAKKGSREAKEGVVGSYIHSNGKVGALVEINCETDFVARNDVLQQFVKDICMQIVALNPMALSSDDLPEDVVNQQKEVILGETKGKPENIVEKILAGKLDSFYKDNCLLSQPFIKDNDVTIQELLNNVTAKTGEKIVINKFSRFAIGG